MANLSNYGEELILDHIFNGETLDLSDCYLGLVDSNAESNDLENNDLTDEITDYDGDRKSVSVGDFISAFQDSGKGKTYNQDYIDFENMPEVDVKFVILCDAATPSEGNIIIWGEPENVRTTNEGDTYRLLAEEYVTTID